MKSPKNYIIAFLALTTVGGALLAWQQYGELVELRAGALNREERADLQRRIADLERLNRGLQDRLAALGGNGEVDERVADADGGERPDGERGGRGDRGRGDPRSRGGDSRQQFAAVRELMAKPEVQAMISLQQKAAIEARYAALFKNLNLSPEQAEKLKTLLADRSNTRRDVEEAARAQGINPREEPDAYRKLLADAQNLLNSDIKATIGEQGFAQLQNFEQTIPQRNLVDNLQQRLNNSSMPLSSTQAEQLVQILAANAPPRNVNAAGQGQPGDVVTIARGPGGMVVGGPGDFGRGGPDMGRMLGGGFGGPMGGATVTAAAVSQAQTILAPPQLAALQQIQQQQQAQQQLQQLVRDTLAANAPAANTGATKAGTGSGTGSAPSRKRGGG